MEAKARISSRSIMERNVHTDPEIVPEVRIIQLKLSNWKYFVLFFFFRSGRECGTYKKSKKQEALSETSTPLFGFVKDIIW